MLMLGFLMLVYMASNQLITAVTNIRYNRRLRSGR